MKCIGCTEIYLSTITDFSFFGTYFLGAQTSITVSNALVTTLLYEDDKMCYHHSDQSKLQSSLPSYSKVHMTPMLFKKAQLDLFIITIMIRITMVIKNLVRKRGRVAKRVKNLQLNQKDPSSNPTGRLVWLRDTTSIRGSRWPLGRNLTNRSD